MFRKANKKMPHVVFWNLNGCDPGMPVVATEPGAVLVSGYSASLVKDVLNSGSVDPLGLVEHALSAPLFEKIAVPFSDQRAEVAVRVALALEGSDARCGGGPSPGHTFEAGEDWEMVAEVVPVEAETVEAAEPKRSPLLAVRGVRRFACGDSTASEDALLALIGCGGRTIIKARDLLSAAAAHRLQKHARVWLDVEFVDCRLGAMAVTLAARLPEATLKDELSNFLLPATDALLKRATREADEASRRKEAWESGAWAVEWEARQNEMKRHNGHCWHYDDDLGEVVHGPSPNSPTGKASPPPPPKFLTPDDVVVTLLATFEGTAQAAIQAAVEELRKPCPWPSPRKEYYVVRERRAGARHRSLTAGRHELMQELKWARKAQVEDAEHVANHCVDEKTRHREKAMPRGGFHDEPALGSRCRIPKQQDSAKREELKVQHQLQNERERTGRLRQQRRTAARDGKRGDGYPAET